MLDNKYYVIDAHCHIYPEKIAARAVAGTDGFYGEHSFGTGTVSGLLEVGDKVGIDHYIVQSVATTPHQVRGINDFIADSVKNSDGKFTGLGTLHPDTEDLDGDIKHLIDLGLKGVKLHHDIQQFKIDDYRCLKIYEKCEEFGLPILMHTGDHRFDFSNPNRMKPVLEKHPDLTVIGAHFGGWLVWDDATRMLSKYKNFFVDCSSSFYAMTPEKARELIFAYGTDRVLFGTDYPMWDIEAEMERFMSIELTDTEREDILYNNAAKMFLNQ